MNKILFLGDSFTWGQGLYFYKWKDENKQLPNDVGGMYPSHSDFITKEDLIYKDTLSFTNLVSSHYNLTPIKREKNGGSNTEIIFDMLPMIDLYNNSIQKLVFQFTSISRYQFRDLNLREEDSNISSFNELFEERRYNFFNYIDSIIKYFSKLYNFEYCYMDWLGDFHMFSPNKFVKFKDDKNTYNYFGKFLDDYVIDLEINKLKILDKHFNKDGQQILSSGIITYFG